MATDDSDITIGPAKLLGLFFMLVAICGVFFAIGYSLGKTSAREQAMNDKNPLSASLAAPAVGDSSAAKPSAAVAAKSEPEANASQEHSAGPSAPDLTFFNAVRRSDHDSQATAKEAPAAASAKPKPDKENAQTGSQAAIQPEPNSAKPAAVTTLASNSTSGAEVKQSLSSGSFVVQIAAVTREEDAAALAGALRKKSYSVFVVNNPTVHDKLYHVQVGPFATLQDAEAMKLKLTGEGYNPIVKRT